MTAATPSFLVPLLHLHIPLLGFRPFVYEQCSLRCVSLSGPFMLLFQPVLLPDGFTEDLFVEGLKPQGSAGSILS